jgi:hypothetical protein
MFACSATGIASSGAKPGNLAEWNQEVIKTAVDAAAWELGTALDSSRECRQ